MKSMYRLSTYVKLDLAFQVVFPALNQQLIDSCCKELTSATEYFRSILNENTLYGSEEWGGERFKQDFLLTSVSAIRQKNHAEIWASLQTASGDLIVDCIMDMLESVKPNSSPDEILSRGIVPRIIDIPVATEILHICFPKSFPVRNEKIEAGFIYLNDSEDKCEIKSLNYAGYIEVMDILAVDLQTYLKERGFMLAPGCRFYFLEKLLTKISEKVQRGKL